MIHFNLCCFAGVTQQCGETERLDKYGRVSVQLVSILKHYKAMNVDDDNEMGQAQSYALIYEAW